MHLPNMIIKESIRQFFIRLLTAIVLGSLFIYCFFLTPPIIFSLLLGLVLLIILISEWPRLFSPRSLTFWLLMPLYPIMPLIMLILINQSPIYRPLLLVLFVLVVAHDAGSYIAGNLFGAHAIAPSISPNKTWEGFFGGYLITSAIALPALSIIGKKISIPLVLLIAFLVCAISIAGDFFESWLKRRAGIKDSGSILPGHGGLLDRFDAILFVAVLFYLLKDVLIKL